MSADPRAPSPHHCGCPLDDAKFYGVSGQDIIALQTYAEDFQRDHYRRMNNLKRAVMDLADNPQELPSFMSKIALLLSDLEHDERHVRDFSSLCLCIYNTAVERACGEAEKEPDAEGGAQ